MRLISKCQNFKSRILSLGPENYLVFTAIVQGKASRISQVIQVLHLGYFDLQGHTRELVVVKTLISYQRKLRGSVNFPARAVAAAVIGLTKWVREPGPWRPS